MKKIIGLTLCLGALAARADVKLNLNLEMGPTPLMVGRQPNGGMRAGTGYELGTSFVDLTVNGKAYRAGLRGAVFFDLGAALSGALLLNFGPADFPVSFQGGVAVDLFNGPEGRSVFNRFRWDTDFFPLAAASTHF